MKLTDVIIKPLLSEKTDKQTQKNNVYTFVVDKKANKLEIMKAVKLFYNVEVKDVNTAILPSKVKAKQTKSGMVVGRKPAKKKAYVTLAKDETIDLYSTI